MKRKEIEEIHAIPYPSTLREAHEAFEKLVRHFCNGEKVAFDMNYSDKEELIRWNVRLDKLNDTIAILFFMWLADSGYEKAIEAFTPMHLSKDEARNLADCLNYFVKEIEKKGDEQ